MPNTSATVSYTQGGFLSIPKSQSTSKAAIKAALQLALENDFKVIFDEDSDVEFEDFSFELTDHDDTESHFNFMLSFELKATFQTEGDPEEEAYQNIGFEVSGFEKYFDVKHTEMINIL